MENLTHGFSSAEVRARCVLEPHGQRKGQALSWDYALNAILVLALGQ